MFIEYNGKLDHPDRMVSDYQELWRKVWNVKQCNVELIPEWFYLPEMFTNHNFCSFGERGNGKIVSDLSLPLWAKEDPFKFVMYKRRFIESGLYNNNINYWIDMLFGVKQQSQKMRNIFFEVWDNQYFYKLDRSKVFDRMLLRSVADFFQLPCKILDKKHSKLHSEEKE